MHVHNVQNVRNASAHTIQKSQALLPFSLVIPLIACIFIKVKTHAHSLLAYLKITPKSLKSIPPPQIRLAAFVYLHYIFYYSFIVDSCLYNYASSYIVVIPTEIAYTAPKGTVLTPRKRVPGKDVEEDMLISAAIKSGKTPTQLAAIRTPRQVRLYEEYKEGRNVVRMLWIMLF